MSVHFRLTYLIENKPNVDARVFLCKSRVQLVGLHEGINNIRSKQWTGRTAPRVTGEPVGFWETTGWSSGLWENLLIFLEEFREHSPDLVRGIERCQHVPVGLRNTRMSTDFAQNIPRHLSQRPYIRNNVNMASWLSKSYLNRAMSRKFVQTWLRWTSHQFGSCQVVLYVTLDKHK